MHVVERGIDEALVVGDVIIRVISISNDGEVRLAISSPDDLPRYREVVLRVDQPHSLKIPVGTPVSTSRC